MWGRGEVFNVDASGREVATTAAWAPAALCAARGCGLRMSEWRDGHNPSPRPTTSGRAPLLAVRHASLLLWVRPPRSPQHTPSHSLPHALPPVPPHSNIAAMLTEPPHPPPPCPSPQSPLLREPSPWPHLVPRPGPHGLPMSCPPVLRLMCSMPPPPTLPHPRLPLSSRPPPCPAPPSSPQPTSMSYASQKHSRMAASSDESGPAGPSSSNGSPPCTALTPPPLPPLTPTPPRRVGSTITAAASAPAPRCDIAGSAMGDIAGPPGAADPGLPKVMPLNEALEEGSEKGAPHRGEAAHHTTWRRRRQQGGGGWPSVAVRSPAVHD